MSWNLFQLYLNGLVFNTKKPLKKVVISEFSIIGNTQTHLAVQYDEYADTYMPMRYGQAQYITVQYGIGKCHFKRNTKRRQICKAKATPGSTLLVRSAL